MPQIRFVGPCVICNQLDTTGYYKKHMCNNCYRKNKRRVNPKPIGRKKAWEGPCSICGSYESSNNRFVKKQCHTCYSRLQKGGGITPRQKFNGPCVTCGKEGEDRYFRQLCNACYKRDAYEVKVKSIKRFCSECDTSISRTSRTGRCTTCQHKFRYATDPKYKDSFTISRKLFESTKKGKIVLARKHRKYRANKHKVLNDLQNHEWLAILDFYNYTCAYCGIELGDDITQDHVIPITKGGGHTASNIVPACRSCNGKKGNGPPLKEVVTLSFDKPQ